MERNNLIKKGVVVTVTLLFIGLAFVPSINANISKVSLDDELVEFTTEVCGLNSEKYTVQLSKEDALEVENLIDNIKTRLDGVETREETVEIFNDAIVELDRYGLIGDLSIEQAQSLMTSRYQYLIDNKIFNRINKRIIMMLDENENVLCLIAGKTAETRTFGSMMTFLNIELFLNFFPFPIFALLAILSVFIANIPPVNFFSAIEYGYGWFKAGTHYQPASGWVYTMGLNGIKTWENSFYGQYKRTLGILVGWWYRGAIGFTGISIMYGIRSCFTLGTALGVKIGPNHPD